MSQKNGSEGSPRPTILSSCLLPALARSSFVFLVLRGMAGVMHSLAVGGIRVPLRMQSLCWQMRRETRRVHKVDPGRAEHETLSKQGIPDLLWEGGAQASHQERRPASKQALWHCAHFDVR
jgi:hypothetical protein